MPINVSDFSGRYAVAASFDTLCIYDVARETRAPSSHCPVLVLRPCREVDRVFCAPHVAVLLR